MASPKTIARAPRIAKRTRVKHWQFQPGARHPRYRSDKEIFQKLAALSLGSLRQTGAMEMREGSRRFAEVKCEACGKVKMTLIDNLLTGKN
jgi:hypothetical protein